MKNNHSFPLVALVILAGVIAAFAGASDPSHPAVNATPAAVTARTSSLTE